MSSENNKIRNFRDLEVWKKVIEIAKKLR